MFFKEITMNIFDNIAANLSLKYENSEFYKNKLIKRYKPLITPGVKSQDELIISLEKHFDLELTDKAVMSKTFLELCGTAISASTSYPTRVRPEILTYDKSFAICEASMFISLEIWVEET